MRKIYLTSNVLSSVIPFPESLSSKKIAIALLAVALLSPETTQAKIASSATAFALVQQQLEVRGRVTDEKGTGVPGAAVVVQGTTVGATTDADGNFTLTVPNPTGTLIISSLGYRKQEVPINSRSVINVTLTSDVQALGEVVVTGYGTQRKADVTGATSTVTAEDLNAGVINNPMQAIQGKVAGLNIVSNSGDPTNNRPAIRLRGTSSLSANSEPLIVIDGVAGADLNTVAPEDIESIDVLKDASAAAIYGSRGANGVIIVTTKRGQEGRITVELSSYAGVESVSRTLPFLSADDYVNRLREQGLDVAANDYGARTDWFDELTRNAISHNHSLAVSGGTDKFTYRGSVVYLKQPGIAINSGFDRLNGRLNLTQKAINDKLEVQLLLSQQVSNKDYVDYFPFLLAGRINPTIPVYNDNGTYLQPGIAGFDEFNGSRIPGGFEIENPVARMRQITNESRDRQTLGNLKVYLEPVEGLRFGVNTSINTYNSIYGFFRPSTWRANNNNVSFGMRSEREVIDRLLELTGQYERDFGSHTFNVLGGYTYQKLSNQGLFAANRGFPDVFGYNNIGTGDNPLDREVGSYQSEAILVGFIGRVNYSYNDRYLLTANIRRDGSSRFGENNRWGWFPSLSVGWRLKEESFLQDVGFISDLKLRVGYGVTGNQEGIPDYAARPLYGRSGTYQSGGEFIGAYRPLQNANPDLKWETSSMWNVGLDFAFFDGRLSGSLELYDKNTKDLLFEYPIAIGTRYGSGNLTAVAPNILANVGEISNRGVELALDFLAVEAGDFQWRTLLNLSHNRNRVESLSSGLFQYDPESPRTYGNFGSGQGGIAEPVVLLEGRPVGQFYGPVLRGYGTNDTGAPIYLWEDFGGGGNDPFGADRTFLGDANPNLLFGWGNTLGYKSVELSFLFRGALGHQIVNGPYIYSANPNRFPGNNVVEDAFDTGIPEGLPPAFSSQWVEDGDFVRLDNFRLSYRLPNFWDQITNASVFIAGNNTFVITNYRGIDPEPRLGTSRDIYGGSQSAGVQPGGGGGAGGANLTPAEASTIRRSLGGTDITENDIRAASLSTGIEPLTFYPRTRTFTLGISIVF
ncbi:TonB-dependent receptor [Pontibacter korlensis]|uniref:SusC/RagA family TonB-linked outer membrane protein n=1 Tax=Pontibacter korlensis TaxID=400092 RepID=UPI00069751DD|nr:TonB-dependent receptor [Pontibacter korlensis]